MGWPVDISPPVPRRTMNFATAAAMTDVTAPDNVVRGIALALQADNAAHEIKQTYDGNHPATPTEAKPQPN